MKTPALKAFRAKLAADEPVYGLWVTLESASITEMAVGLGLDFVVIDAEHGHLDWGEILEHVRATVRSNTVILVRILQLDQGIIKRALDIGADGIIIPWVESAEQVRQAFRFARYPLEGVRGIGGERATCWGACLPQHVAEANENVLVIPIIESVTGGRSIDAMLAVPDTEVFFFGPSDYSSSAGFAGQWEGPGVAEQILAIKDKVRAAGKHCGVIATGHANINERVNDGFRMIALGLDGGLLIRGIRGALAAVGRDRGLSTTLDSDDVPVESGDGYGGGGGGARPSAPGAAVTGPIGPTDLASGVHFTPQIGPEDGLPGLLTGLVTFAPGATLAYHKQPGAESVTVLGGKLLVEVEGRMYRLCAYDSLLVPGGLAHAASNPSVSEPTICHVALPAGAMAHTPVDQFFSRRAMPPESRGAAGAETLHRFTTPS
jgi:2-keto-3-deoxy-L-rhamnonate aldolase RhmA/quercetin dioxygenase-like cupin family protein